MLSIHNSYQDISLAEPESPRPDYSSEENTNYDTFKWLWLLVNTSIAAALGSALIIFVVVKVPIAWDLSQCGQKYPEVTNVIVAVVTTLCTRQLKYTLKLAVEHSASIALNRGITVDQWDWLQALAQTSMLPPSNFRHKRA
ncbi:hypothetical protein DFH09DRAFT_1082473 [Mycena vulgaris]|nr:hypothetical protein DFH09DRAFT_1082473 [Mycena vulgaris]